MIREVKPRKPRPRTYGDDLLPALIRCWVLLCAPDGKIMAPFMPALVPLLRAEGEIQVSDEQAVLLSGIPATAIDRMLMAERQRMTPAWTFAHHARLAAQAPEPDPHLRRLGRRRAGVRRDRPGRPRPRRGVASGEYCYTLTMTDITTGWTVNRSAPNRARVWVINAACAWTRLCHTRRTTRRT